MRAFFSIHIDENIAERILAALPKHPRILWYPRQNLHITLQFVGDVMAHEMLKLVTIGEDAAKEIPPFSLQPAKIVFADGRVRLAIEPNADLTKLHDFIAGALKNENLGKPDESPYAPHITLGRPDKTLKDFLDIPRDVPYGEMPVHSFGIFLSEQGAHNMGSYTLFKEFPLSLPRR